MKMVKEPGMVPCAYTPRPSKVCGWKTELEPSMVYGGGPASKRDRKRKKVDKVINCVRYIS